MKILLANDDGVHAPGIKGLYQELSPHYKVVVVAPTEERSTTGHSLSLDRPLRLEKVEDNIFGCTGFPADCVFLALGHILKDDRPDVVISGINRGANLGQDLFYSGTVAAAREAAFHQVPALAVSLVLDHQEKFHCYHTAATFIRYCLELELHKHCTPLTLFNINVPNLEIQKIKGVKITEVGFRRYSEQVDARIDSRNKDYFWVAGLYQGHLENINSDCYAVEEGYISITPHVLVDQAKGKMSGLEKVIEKLNAKFHS